MTQCCFFNCQALPVVFFKYSDKIHEPIFQCDIPYIKITEMK